MNVDEIKQKYPKPSTADEGKCRTNLYCVGGAFCMAYAESIGNPNAMTFPPDQELAEWLTRANSELPLLNAKWYANMLTCANDRGDFGMAWEYLRRALSYTTDNNLGI